MPVLHVKELWHREVKVLPPGHTASKWQSQQSNVEPIFYHTMLSSVSEWWLVNEVTQLCLCLWQSLI